ncbi:N-acetylmuramic acid 6-phosphate etherase [Aestuariispira insulae]|uniref:N-acetylmuramic acid 6-phosphate etherase n=1 Tax=Aestuariispira insulae TaxID=1461337 RepID=A0A3D9HQC4_9PROT|nr:N-acetylmuramic acid 6-phosphate etherase [Aestuariispira insulae]RED51595.1 N-acetylmuramic acid 6-phosphate etherase [Aestuariispira insulae]
MRESERISPKYKGLDTWGDEDVLSALWDSQMAAVAAVRPALPSIAAAAQAIVTRLKAGDARLVYVGAGSSGLLATQDGMELPPTFGWPRERLTFLMAGGSAARLSLEGASEDDADAARQEVAHYHLGEADVVIGVAASGGTPYTVAALEAARERGALTVAIANTPGCRLLDAAEFPICIETGLEVIAGSTRLGAGTAQKATLGMLSSLVMTRMGHVIDGMMVSVEADNIKLRERAIRIVSVIAECDEAAAKDALGRTQGKVKPAILVAMGMAPEDADRRLNDNGGDVRSVMNLIQAQ